MVQRVALAKFWILASVNPSLLWVPKQIMSGYIYIYTYAYMYVYIYIHIYIYAYKVYVVFRTRTYRRRGIGGLPACCMYTYHHITLWPQTQ